MSQDRLEKALQEMREEDVDAGTLEAAQRRVWEQVTAGGTCAHFRDDFTAYLNDTLGNGRRLLVEDHLGRCARCRAVIAGMKGERTVIPMPRRSPRRWVQWGGLAAAAAVLVAAVYVGRDSIDSMMAPGGSRARSSTRSRAAPARAPAPAAGSSPRTRWRRRSR